MQVGIAGAGAIGMGYAAHLLAAGHEPHVWSPSGRRTAPFESGRPLDVSGVLEGQFYPDVAPGAAALATSDVIIIALPAYGHRAVFDALLPYLEGRHTLIISGHLSFGALYLSKKLAQRGIQIPIVAWSTTALTAKAQSSPVEVRISAVRRDVAMSVIPSRFRRQGTEICAQLFGNRFSPADDLLTIALSNLNPQNHLGIALCNLTRIERAETWGQTSNVTPAVGRFLEALDRERVEIAQGFGKEVRTVLEHLASSFGIAGNSVAEINAARVAAGSDVLGPKDMNTRYILEDVPFGLIPTLLLADMTGVNARLHQAGIDILSACYGRNFASDNDLLPELQHLDPVGLRTLAVEGYPV